MSNGDAKKEIIVSRLPRSVTVNWPFNFATDAKNTKLAYAAVINQRAGSDSGTFGRSVDAFPKILKAYINTRNYLEYILIQTAVQHERITFHQLVTAKTK